MGSYFGDTTLVLPAKHLIVGASEYCLSSAVGYLLGSIPTGYLAAKGKGIDIRKYGSGNIGATNAFRVLGKPAGILVLVVDALKGALAAAVVPHLFHRLTGSSDRMTLEYASIIGGISVVLGHNYPVWLRFKGGKGIATSAGVVMALVPLALATVLSIWLLVLALTRFVSIASIAAALCLPFAVWWFDGTAVMVGFTTLLSLLAIFKHRSNIKRLLQGTEHRIGQARPHSPPVPPA